MKIRFHLVLSAFVLFLFATDWIEKLSWQDVSTLSVLQNNDSLIIIYGDTRTNHDVHKSVVSAIRKMNPVAVFHTGDLVFNGKKRSQWAIFNAIEGPLIKQTRFYPSLGNHERSSRLYQLNFELPNNGKWYSVNISGVHFIVLDNTSSLKPGSIQFKWLEEDLAASAKTSDFRIVIEHYPPYSTSYHQDQMTKLQANIIPLFEKYHVNAVFAGHNHCYERCLNNGIYYITTGGGGAPLYAQRNSAGFSQLYLSKYHFCTLDIETDRIFVSALDTNMIVLDTFSIIRDTKD